jgi:hypothetical protein
LVGKPQGKILDGRSRHRFKNDIKKILGALDIGVWVRLIWLGIKINGGFL